jgi:YD repeat-containing protein
VELVPWPYAEHRAERRFRADFIQRQRIPNVHHLTVRPTTTNSYTIYNSGTGTPTKVLSVTNNHFSRQTLDGVGHVVLQETGTVSGSTYTTVSQVSSVYAPCGCSPMGKLQQVSEPWAPGGTPVWTTYAYDGLGRTTSVTLPDGSVTQYVYDNRATTDPIASFVDITDPAGKKKRYQMDGYGHLTQVIEDPAGLAYATIYAYDVMDHLYTVQQTRSGTTQTRTFNYKSGSTVTAFLQSATNPENGTVSYTYNSDGTLATKTDAKGVVTEYNYDSQKRLLNFGALSGGVYTPAYTYVYL